MVSCDAKSCHDRIVLRVAALALCCTGIDLAPAFEIMETLQKAMHHMCAAFGVSRRGCKGKSQPPFQGVGQGNGVRLAIYALVSVTLLTIMAMQGPGPNIETSLSGLASTVVLPLLTTPTSHNSPKRFPLFVIPRPLQCLPQSLKLNECLTFGKVLSVPQVVLFGALSHFGASLITNTHKEAGNM